jgi:tRNA pseudouridine55 synthase
VGSFSIEQARTLEQLEAQFDVMALSAAVAAEFPRVDVDAAQALRISQGQRLVLDLPSSPAGIFGPSGEVVALVEDRDGVAQPKCVFA